MIKDYFLLAFRNIRKRGLRSWLTMIGIFIGIAAVVSLIGLGEGLRDAVSGQFGFLGTDILTVTASGGFGPPGTGVVDPLTDKELERIEKVPGVNGVGKRILESGRLQFEKEITVTFAASMPDGRAREVVEDALNFRAEKGRLLRDSDKDKVVLGFDFSQEKDEFEKAVTIGDEVIFEGKTLEVIGFLEKKGNFQLDGSIFMQEDDVREAVGREKDTFDIIVARFDENANVDKIKADIEKELRKIRDVDEGEEDFSVSTPQQTLQGVDDTLLGVQIFIAVIASISILVGGIGIMNTMYTSVVERTKEIGIMKAIGARNSTIFSLFFIESGLIGSVGGIVGAIIGTALAYGFAFAGSLALGSDLIAANVSPNLIIVAILFSFLLGSIFGTLPAIQASKLNPVDALRKAK